MIFGVFDKFSSRRRGDKAYEVENLVLTSLRERRREIPTEVYDPKTNGIITTPQTTVIYTIIGFHPEIDPEIADNSDERVASHDSAESVERQFLKQFRETMFMPFPLGPEKTNALVKSDKPTLKTLEPDSLEVARKMEEYGILDPEFPYLTFNVSGRQLYDEDKPIFTEVLTDIVEPLSLLSRNEQIDYAIEVKDIKFKNNPSIICVSASASNLTKSLESRK